MTGDLQEDILRALRQITQGIDRHSRWLATRHGLTVPQLVCMRALHQLGEVSPSALARSVSLSQATLSGILDRLVARNLVTRERKVRDRRIVIVALTAEGLELVAQAPPPFQAAFGERLAALSVTEKEAIRHTLQLVVALMNGEPVEAHGARAAV